MNNYERAKAVWLMWHHIFTTAITNTALSVD